MTPCRERLLHFGCEGEALLGVLTEPAEAASPAAASVLILVGGPQYRAGAHRQFVKLARALAEAGHPSLRFDFRGMGDSTGAQRNFESLSPDIGAAIDALCKTRPAAPIVLFGLCDGASAAMLYLSERPDARVTGLCAANPWVRSELGLVRTELRHYYVRRFLSGDFWLKLLRGQVGTAAIGELWGKLTAMLAGSKARPASSLAALPYMERMAVGCEALQPGHLVIALSGEDLTAREFETYGATSARWSALLARHAKVVRFPGTDHTFSQPMACIDLSRAMLSWIRALPAARMVAA